MTNRKPTVIVFCQHCFNALGQIRSLGEMGGVNIDVVWVNGDFHTPKGCRYIRNFHAFDSFDEGYKFILSNYTGNEKRIISTGSDGVVAILNEHYSEIKDRFSFFNAGKAGALNRWMEKLQQYKLAAKNGFRVPHTVLAKVGEIPKNISFPVYTKMPDSMRLSWKGSQMICRTEEELKAAFSIVQTGNILLQEYVQKENEIALEGISFDGGEELFLPIQGEYIRLPESGFGTLKRNEYYSLGFEMKEKLRAMMIEIGYTGVFEAEFLKDKNGCLWFLEINFRHTQYNHALCDMGCNMCKLWFDYNVGKKPLLLPSDLKAPLIVINEKKDYNTFVEKGIISREQWWKDIRYSDSHYLYDRNDILYVIRYLAKFFFLKLKYKLTRFIER